MNQKFFFLSILCFSLVLSCKTTYKQTTTNIAVGEIQRSMLVNDSVYNIWFAKNYKNYRLDTIAINKLKNIKKNNLEVKIVLGTWCSDSQRETPRLIKVLDEINFNPSQVTYFTLDKNKTSPQKIEKTYNIQYVPTFIIYKNGVELNRIVEIPIESIEKDLLNIITVNTYTNIYSE